MIGLITYWDPHPDYVMQVGGSKRWLSSLIFTMEAFGADSLFLVGKPEISHGYNIQHTEHDTLDEILHLHSQAKIVALVGETPAEITKSSLLNYIHPEEDVLYIIGGDYSEFDFETCEGHNIDYVHIEGVIDQNNFWSNVVAAIVLRDRYVKSL